jgi:4-hydroxy-3-polyprenylbenzoate decarboxylase
MFKDLREYIETLKRLNMLTEINAEISADLQISKILREYLPLKKSVIFNNVKGHKMKVFGNAFASMEHMHTALNLTDFSEPANRVLELTRQLPGGYYEALKQLSKLKDLFSVKPKPVKNGPVKDKISDKFDFDSLPILKTWPGDAGRFITFPLVVTKSKDDRYNLGVYRMQIYDSKTAGMHWQIHKHGAENFEEAEEKIEVAVVIGADPATIYSAVAPVPKQIDDYLFSGLLRGSPLELVNCESIDLQVPANAEIILEGYVEKNELREEGPFGDHTGYYTPPEKYPVFHLKNVMMRSDPIYHTTVVGRPVMEDAYIGKTVERMFLPLIQMFLPEVVDINLPFEGVFHNILLVSIKKRFPGQARKVVFGLWGLDMLALTKYIIVVDSDINVQDLGEVLWALGTRSDPKRDSIVTEGPLDVLDHASYREGFGGKMGIDATKKLENEGYDRNWADSIEESKEIEKWFEQRKKDYGL